MRMNPDELGQNLAQLVWESFSDFLERWGAAEDQEDGTVVTVTQVDAEEALILFLWMHTRACQQAFAGRVDADRQKAVLDAMHAAVYEDLEARYITRAQLPLFEQRVSARYADYYEAANATDGNTVVEVAARRLGGPAASKTGLSIELAEITAETAGPLRDFLEEIELAD